MRRYRRSIVETSALAAEMSAIARSYLRYRAEFPAIAEMCNRATNHGDMSTFSKPAIV